MPQSVGHIAGSQERFGFDCSGRGDLSEFLLQGDLLKRVGIGGSTPEWILSALRANNWCTAISAPF
jgi:hypothetical protein